MISQEDAKKYYNAGVNVKDKGVDLEVALIDYFGSYSDWSSYKIFELGFRGQPFEIKEWERYHDIKLDTYSGQPLPSYNHMNDRPEKGVSVIYSEWEQTVHGKFYIANAIDKNYKRIKFSGIDTGFVGGDGEPLVVPVKAS